MPAIKRGEATYRTPHPLVTPPDQEQSTQEPRPISTLGAGRAGMLVAFSEGVLTNRD